MADLLIVECHINPPCETMQHILDCLKTQKETGAILLLPCLEAQVVSNGIEIKLIDENRNENCNAYYVDEINNHLCGYKTIIEKE